MYCVCVCVCKCLIFWFSPGHESRCTWNGKVPGWKCWGKNGCWRIERVFLRARGKGTLMHGSADTAVVTLRLFLTLPVGSCLMRTDSTLACPNVSVKLSSAFVWMELKLFEGDVLVVVGKMLVFVWGRGGCRRNVCSGLHLVWICLRRSRNLLQCCEEVKPGELKHGDVLVLPVKNVQPRGNCLNVWMKLFSFH